MRPGATVMRPLVGSQTLCYNYLATYYVAHNLLVEMNITCLLLTQWACADLSIGPPANSTSYVPFVRQLWIKLVCRRSPLTVLALPNEPCYPYLLNRTAPLSELVVTILTLARLRVTGLPFYYPLNRAVIKGRPFTVPP